MLRVYFLPKSAGISPQAFVSHFNFVVYVLDFNQFSARYQFKKVFVFMGFLEFGIAFSIYPTHGNSGITVYNAVAPSLLEVGQTVNDCQNSPTLFVP